MSDAPTPHPAGTDDARRAVATAARALLAGERPVLVLAGLDADVVLLESAWIVHGQLGLLQQTFVAGGSHPRIIAGIVDLAESYDVSSRDAVGVAGALVGALTGGDEVDLARLLAAAHRRAGPSDLVAGAAALLAAATSYLADALAESPLELHDEIHRRPFEPGVDPRRFCRSRRG